MEVRPYQVLAYNQVIAAMRQHDKVVLQLPTGAGKSIIAVRLMQIAAKNNKRVCVITERITLTDQMAEHCKVNGIEFGVIRSDDPRRVWGSNVQITTIQTLARRPKFDSGLGFDLFIVDECHLLHKHHKVLMERFSNSKWLGLTATPWRKGLGNHWDTLVNPVTPKELIRDGYLSDWVAYGPPNSQIDTKDIKVVRGEYDNKEVQKRTTKLYANIISEWRMHCAGLRTLVFAASIVDSKEFCERFRAIGVRAEHVDAYTDDQDTRRILEDFKSTPGSVLCSVSKLSTGADLPAAEVGILARPIRSQMLHYQIMGRLLRWFPGKIARFHDHAGNIERLGLPDEPPQLELDKGKVSDTEIKREKLPVYCKKCGKLKQGLECPHCGHKPVIQASIEEKQGRLKQIATISRKLQFLQMLTYYEREVGYKKGWALHMYKAKFKEEPRHKWVKHTVKPDAEVERFIRCRRQYNRIRYAKRPQ